MEMVSFILPVVQHHPCTSAKFEIAVTPPESNEPWDSGCDDPPTSRHNSTAKLTKSHQQGGKNIVYIYIYKYIYRYVHIHCTVSRRNVYTNTKTSNMHLRRHLCRNHTANVGVLPYRGNCSTTQKHAKMDVRITISKIFIKPVTIRCLPQFEGHIVGNVLVLMRMERHFGRFWRLFKSICFTKTSWNWTCQST